MGKLLVEEVVCRGEGTGYRRMALDTMTDPPNELTALAIEVERTKRRRIAEGEVSFGVFEQ